MNFPFFYGNLPFFPLLKLLHLRSYVCVYTHSTTTATTKIRLRMQGLIWLLVTCGVAKCPLV